MRPKGSLASILFELKQEAANDLGSLALQRERSVVPGAAWGLALVETSHIKSKAFAIRWPITPPIGI